MRTTVLFLVIIMFLLICNIIAYIINEDYRFFLKKLKHQEEVVYDPQLEISDEDTIKIIDSSTSQVLENNSIQANGKNLDFLNTLSGKNTSNKETEKLPALGSIEQEILEIFSGYTMQKISKNTSLMAITTEFPNEYHQWYSEDVELYIFPLNTYGEVKKIFEVLQYELPYTLNVTNDFGDRSFFINLKESLQDGEVRIIGEYEKVAFGLKIKKDSYNKIHTLFKSK